MRKPLIAGNWKMNVTPTEAVRLIETLKPMVANTKCEVVVCPTAATLFAAKQALQGSAIQLGAQNVHFADSGAYTGEVNVATLLELGVAYVILGHSERRAYFGETDETVNEKVKQVIKHGLRPIVCVGEDLAQREQGVTKELVCLQIKKALHGVSATEVENVVVAYEPIWAIGTGVTASAKEADETIAHIRAALAELYGGIVAGKVRILYGGSMNAENATALMAMKDIDGGLIGGASLKPEAFAGIVNH